MPMLLFRDPSRSEPQYGFMIPVSAAGPSGAAPVAATGSGGDRSGSWVFVVAASCDHPQAEERID